MWQTTQRFVDKLRGAIPDGIIEAFTINEKNWTALLHGHIIITNKTEHTLIAYMTPVKKTVAMEKNINANAGVSAIGVDVGVGYAIKNNMLGTETVTKIAIGPQVSLGFSKLKDSYLTLEYVPGQNSPRTKFTICENYEVKKRCEYIFEDKHFTAAHAAFSQ